MATIKMSAEEKKWQALRDAETMASYLEILSSPDRARRAREEARKMAEKLNQRVKAMQFAAGGKMKRK